MPHLVYPRKTALLGGISPIALGIFTNQLNDYTTLSTTSSMPSGGSITRAGNAMLYDSTGKLTWAPNNLWLQNNTFATSPWYLGGGTALASNTNNSASAPDGTMTAGTLVTGAASATWTQNISAVGSTYIVSVWARVQSGTGNLTLSLSGTSPSLTVTTNWQRFSFRATGVPSGTQQVSIGLTTTSKAYELWGGQVEAATYQTAPSGTYYLNYPTPNTTAAYYGPRFDVDPVTLQNKGLLVEGARTNLASQSSVSTASPWATYINGSGSITVTVPGNITSPDGTSNAAKIVVNRSASTDYAEQYQNFTGTAASYTFSIWLKADSGADVGKLVSVAMLNGTTIVGATLVTLTANWARYTTTATLAASATCQINIGYLPNANGGGTQTGSVSFNAFGAQVELGSFASSYIPTVASSVVRATEALAVSGITTNLTEAFYTDEATGISSSLNYNAGTSPSTPYAWTTSLRTYQNAYAGDISSPSWLAGGSDGTAGGYSPSVRSSNATYYDSTGMLTYGPANAVKYSNKFDDTAWTSVSSGVTLTSGQSDPFGGTTAYRLQGTTSSWALTQNAEVVGPALISVWVKSNTGSSQTFRLYGNNSTASSDLTATTSWQRLSFAFSQNGTTGVGIARNSANATADLLIYGLQVELITYQTSPRAYIPTTSAAVYQPRYDYDPSVTPATPRGMLIEESRVNYQRYSEAFSSWNANSNMTITSGATISPDGRTNGSLIVPNTTSGQHYVWDSLSSISGASTATISVYVKGAGYTQVGVAFAATSRGVNFELSTQTATPNFAGYTGTITSVGNGWYRLTVTGPTAATDYGYVSVLNTGTVYSGNGVSGIYLWGAQLEIGSFPTSYIPTTTASVTRVADVVKLSGSALTVAGAATGSAIVQTTAWLDATGATRYLLASSTSRRLLYSGGSNTGLSSYDGTTILNATFGSGTWTGGPARAAVGWAAPGASLAGNNGTVGTSASINLGTGAAVYLGGSSSSGATGGYWFASMALYNQRLPDTILKAKSVVGSPY